MFDGSLQFQADIGEFDIARLGAQSVGLAVELLREKIEPPADGPAVFDEMPRRRHMGGEAIKFFAHVGFGRDHDRFLVQTVGIETLGLREKVGDLLGQPGANGLRPAPGRPLGSLGQGSQLAKARGQNAFQCIALAAAHFNQRRDGPPKPGDDSALGATPLVLALLGIGYFDDAFKRQQSVE